MPTPLKTVKTTLELPADLVQEMKLKAVQEHRRIKDVATEALRRGLLPEQRSEPDRIRHRVKLPLIRGGHPAAPGEELTPERIAQILEDEDVERFLRASGVSS
ncbi:MAG: hypothetical protein BGO26_13480 [Actinobacteria bacterium 69-20]|nr:antitoxin [Actinomycetota bacterium]OJV24305.1 MAG: hypothetical protein BGO26_13480 [Actinobacteria bacterium 69-20]